LKISYKGGSEKRGDVSWGPPLSPLGREGSDAQLVLCRRKKTTPTSKKPKLRRRKKPKKKKTRREGRKEGKGGHSKLFDKKKTEDYENRKKAPLDKGKEGGDVNPIFFRREGFFLCFAWEARGGG